MSLPRLFTIEEDLQAWAFNHASIHADIVKALPGFAAPKTITGLQSFQLYPIDPTNLGLWLYYHQTMHNQANLVLGTIGYDLLSLDLDDPEDVQQWLFLNGEEHQRIATALKVE